MMRVTSIGNTSQRISSRYSPKWRRKWHCWVIRIGDVFIQVRWNGLGWDSRLRPNLVTQPLEITLLMLPLSIISLHTCSPHFTKIWEMLFLIQESFANGVGAILLIMFKRLELGLGPSTMISSSTLEGQATGSTYISTFINLAVKD